MYELSKKRSNNCKFINLTKEPVTVTSITLKLLRRPLIFDYKIIRNASKNPQVEVEDSIEVMDFSEEWLEKQFVHFKLSRDSINSINVRIESTVSLDDDDKIVYDINETGARESMRGLSIVYRANPTDMVVVKLAPNIAQENCLMVSCELIHKTAFLLATQTLTEDDYRVTFEIMDHPPIKGDFRLLFENEDDMLIDIEEVVFIVKR